MVKAISRTKLLPLLPSPAVVMEGIKVRTISEQFPSASEDSFRVLLNIFEQND